MAREFPLEPRDVPKVNTKYRCIVTPLPAPESLPLLERLRACEPQSMRGQPPLVWDRAEGFQVYDKYGNMWLDFSSGVLITNAGHGRKGAQGEQGVSRRKHGFIFRSGPRPTP